MDYPPRELNGYVSIVHVCYSCKGIMAPFDKLSDTPQCLGLSRVSMSATSSDRTGIWITPPQILRHSAPQNDKGKGGA